MSYGQIRLNLTAFKNVCLMATAVSLAACTVAPLERTNAMTQSLETERAAVLASGDRWLAYYQAGEIDKMRDLYEDDALVHPHGSPRLNGADETIDFFKRNQRSNSKVTLRSEPEDLVIEGDKAFLVTKFAMRITSPDGKTKDTSGRTFLVYRKGADGMWRVWRDMDNYAPDVQLKIGD